MIAGGLGHKFDPIGHQATGFHVLAAAAAVDTPESVDLEPFAPPVLAQKDTGSCVGHARCCAAYTTCARAGRPLPFLPSPTDTYRLARCIDRLPNEDGSLPALVDEGSMPNQADRAQAEWGVRPIRWNDDKTGDVDLPRVNDEPMLGDLEKDEEITLPGAYRISSVGAQRVREVRRALGAGFAVCLAVLVDHAFDTFDGSHPIGAADPATVRGSHYIYLIGYRTVNGKTIFKFRNSWSAAYGVNGNGEGNEDFLAGASDIYVMAISPKAGA